MASTSSTRLSTERKRKAQNDFVNWWLADQQRQMNFRENASSTYQAVVSDKQNMSCGTFTQASSSTITCSDKASPRTKGSKGLKRVFDLRSDSSSSGDISNVASTAFRSNSPFIKRVKMGQNGEKGVYMVRPSSPPLKEEKNFSGQKYGATRGMNVITHGMGHLSFALVDTNYGNGMSSRSPFSVQGWSTDASDPVLYDLLSRGVQQDHCTGEAVPISKHVVQ